LNDQCFPVAEDKARILGATAEQFTGNPIDTEQALARLSFDLLLVPLERALINRQAMS
jgi:hypothetical protein